MKRTVKVIINDLYDFLEGEVVVAFDNETQKHSYLIRLPEKYEELLKPIWEDAHKNETNS